MEFESSVNSAKTILLLEVQCNKLQQENHDLKEEVMEAKGEEEEIKDKYAKVKDKLVKTKEKFDSQERKWREEEEKNIEIRWQLEAEKKKLEVELKAATSRREDGGDSAAEKLKETEALKRLFEEQDDTIVTLLGKNESLERHCGRLQMDFEIKMGMEARKQKMEEDEKILVLTHKIEVLERERRELEAEFCKVEEENRSKDERICVLEKVKEDEKRAMEEECEEKVSELAFRIEVLERERRELEAKFCLVGREKSEEMMRIMNEKMTTEAESKRKVLEQVRRIEVLERENREIKAEVCQANKEKTEEINRVLNEEILVFTHKIEVLEAESKRKVLEQVRRIEALERENREIKAECQANKEKTEEINRVLNEKILVLTHKIEVLEAEKRKWVEGCEVRRKSEEKCRLLEVEKRKLEIDLEEAVKRVVGNDEVVENLKAAETEIGALKRSLVYKDGIIMMWVKSIDRLEREKVKIEEELRDTVLKLEAVKNVLGNGDSQSSGSEYVDLSDTESKGSSDSGSRGQLGSKIKKRKVEGPGCSLANQASTKRCKSDGLKERKLVWKNAEDMNSALTVNDELCMRSVCALYRNTKFIQPHETRVMALGELLTSGDPQGKLKLSLAEFKQADPCGLEDCRSISRQHDAELFFIYRNNLDPLFVSGDDMN